MGWVATVQTRGVELRDVASGAVEEVLDERPVRAVGALDACFVAAADDGVYVVVPGESPRRVIDLPRAIVARSSPSDRRLFVARGEVAARIGCEGIVRGWAPSRRP